MDKIWNKVVLAAVATAGVAAGVLYLKHRKDMADLEKLLDEEEDDVFVIPEADTAAPIPTDRSYIDLTHTAETDEEAAEAAVEAPEEAVAEAPEEAVAEAPEEAVAEAPEETESNVHYSTL